MRSALYVQMRLRQREHGHGSCKALIWAVSGLHAWCCLGGLPCAVCWASAKDNSKSNGNAVTVNTAQGRAVSLLQPFPLPPMAFSLLFFFFFFLWVGRSLHLLSDLPIPCPQCWREISTDEKTQKKPAGANMREPTTGRVSSKVSEHGLFVPRGHRCRTVSGPGATAPVGNCERFN